MSLSEEQIARCQNIFSQFDKDNSGRIDRFELRVVMEQLGLKPSEEELFAMINEVDEDNTGKIEFHEFLKVYEQSQAMVTDEDEQDFIDAFVAMGGNPDKSGSVKADELVRIIRIKFEMTIDIERLIEDVDTDHSGVIEYDEFKALLSH